MQSWDDLKYFLAIARNRSLAGAARSLKVNHSTVYRRLEAFESGAGVRLFERLADGYVLTEAGEELMQSASHIGEVMEDLERQLVGRDYRLSGLIRLTTTDTIAESFLYSHLQGFQDVYPDIVLEVISDNLLYDLSRRDADVALRPTNQPPEHLVGRELTKVPWAMYGAKSYLDRKGVPHTLGDLAAHAVICADESLSSVPAMRWLRSQVPESSISFRGSSFASQFAAARAGCGIALLPCVLAESAPELQRVYGPVETLTTGLWILTHPDLRNTARIRAFMGYLAKAMANSTDTVTA